MRQAVFVLVASVIYFPLSCVAGQLAVTPTTSLAAQTLNNTSAANTFSTQVNGNLGARNISKVDVHSLLYPGASTKVYAHMVLWFGQSNHMNVGYNSGDPVEIKRQISDMISRGIEGVIMVWYGPNNFIDRAAQLVMREVESHPGFTFAIMIDHGAIQWNSCPGCTPQQALTAQLGYVEQTYFPSPAYLRVNGQPVVTNFDIDRFYQIDWNALGAALPSQPTFLFQNNGGFTHALTGGAYSWVMPTAPNFGMSYLSSFYSTAMVYPNLQPVGAAYKGFNDTLASWSLQRIMGQQCGQTWLQTFSGINGLYSSSDQLPMMQLVTWNDYEEGTEIETGIDNCVSLSASLAGSAVKWSTAGNEGTIDHYTVYVSNDGQNLMPLADLPIGYYSFDLCSYSLPPGPYSVFVQAVGKPTLVNHISVPLPYSPSCGPGVSPTFILTPSPVSISVGAGQPGIAQISITPQSGSFNQPIALSCANLPAAMSCNFSPPVVIPGRQGASAVLRVSMTPTPAPSQQTSPRRKGATSLYSSVLGFAVAGVFMGSMNKRRMAQVFIVVIGAAILFSSCGGSLSPRANAKALVSRRAYDFAIVGTCGTTQATTHARVTIR